jgi:hypothetical protein
MLAATASPAASRWELARRYLDKLVDAFDPLLGALTFAGILLWPRTFFRRDQQSVFAMCMVSLSAIGMFAVQSHDVIARYFFAVVIVSLPYGGLALDALASALSRAAGRLGAHRLASRGAVLAALLIAAGSIGWTDALTNNYESRRLRRELGSWLAERVGPDNWIVGSEPRSMMLSFYAEGRYLGPRPEQLASDAFRAFLEAERPAAVVVWADPQAGGLETPWCQRFCNDPALAPEFELAPREQLPQQCRRMTVLIRKEAAAQRLANRSPSQNR